MILGDLGADVIKVERPGSGDETRQWGPPWVGQGVGRESAYFLSINRNKRSLAADLTVEHERALVAELADSADVLVENFIPGSLARWGLDAESTRERNPRLIYCSITGYGSASPDARKPGYDFAVQARSGWMAITGDAAGEPTKAGVAVVDVLTGHNAALAVLAALRDRDRSGVGQRVEVSLLGSAVAGLVNVAQAALAGAPIRRYGNAHATIVPYQSFAAADRQLVVAIGNDEQWRRFCLAIGRQDLGDDARFATNPDRVERRDELIPLLQQHLATRTAADWIRVLEPAGVPCEMVRRVDEAVHDPSLRAAGAVWPMEGGGYGAIEVMGSPLRLDRTPAELRRPAPALGEHTQEISERGWL